jgi:predicted nucleic acid-binding Zn ribbon protein
MAEAKSGRGSGRPTVVGDALRAYLAKSGLARRLAQAQVIPEWPRLVGPQIAAVTAPESVAPDGTLFVRVATSAWMTELQLMGPQIMAAINGGRGAGRIKTIRWLLSR